MLNYTMHGTHYIKRRKLKSKKTCKENWTGNTPSTHDEDILLFDVLAAVLRASEDKTKHHFLPVLQVLLGYALHSTGEHKQALLAYGQSNLADQRRITQCLLQLFVMQASQPTQFVQQFSELEFICSAFDIKATLGMHAYRLCLELVHTELRASLGGAYALFDQSLMLRSFRSLPRSTQSTKIMPEQEKRSRSKSYKRVQFTYTEAETKSDIVNEAFLCTKSESTVSR
jgi:hypothetical protein